MVSHKNIDDDDRQDSKGVRITIDTDQAVTISTCTSATCCVWATTKKGKGLCLGGDKSGPTKNPPNLNIDSYYYLEKKYKL